MERFRKHVLSNFDKFTFYIPSDTSLIGTLILSFKKDENDPAPYFWYLLDGLPVIKV
jgi:hypothetical protein